MRKPTAELGAREIPVRLPSLSFGVRSAQALASLVKTRAFGMAESEQNYEVG